LFAKKRRGLRPVAGRETPSIHNKVLFYDGSLAWDVNAASGQVD
jgi:hypothetical protein